MNGLQLCHQDQGFAQGLAYPTGGGGWVGVWVVWVSARRNFLPLGECLGGLVGGWAGGCPTPPPSTSHGAGTVIFLLDPMDGGFHAVS